MRHESPTPASGLQGPGLTTADRETAAIQERSKRFYGAAAPRTIDLVRRHTGILARGLHGQVQRLASEPWCWLIREHVSAMLRCEKFPVTVDFVDSLATHKRRSVRQVARMFFVAGIEAIDRLDAEDDSLPEAEAATTDLIEKDAQVHCELVRALPEIDPGEAARIERAFAERDLAEAPLKARLAQIQAAPAAQPDRSHRQALAGREVRA